MSRDAVRENVISLPWQSGALTRGAMRVTRSSQGERKCGQRSRALGERLDAEGMRAT